MCNRKETTETTSASQLDQALLIACRVVQVTVRHTLHLASNGDTLNPSDRPFLVTFESTLYAFTAGNTGSVALYSTMPACVTCFQLDHLGGGNINRGLARCYLSSLMEFDSDIHA